MKKPTVLLVDDEAIVRDSVSDWLKNSNFEVESAANGVEALERIQQRRFDTAVVDLKMPGMDGLEVMKRVKENSPMVQIIIITAYGTVENAVEALKNGASDYLTKPFTLDRLEKAIEDAYLKTKNEALADNVDISGQATETIAPPKPEVRPEPRTGSGPTPHQNGTGQAMTEEVKEKPKAGKEKQCIWSKAGVVSYRLCTNNYRCDTCEFAQTLMDQGAAAGDRGAQGAALKKMLEKPGPQRACRYTLSGDISYKLCPNVYQCYRCAFDQQMQEKIDAKAEQMAARVKGMKERKVKKTDAAGE